MISIYLQKFLLEDLSVVDFVGTSSCAAITSLCLQLWSLCRNLVATGFEVLHPKRKFYQVTVSRQAPGDVMSSLFSGTGEIISRAFGDL